MADETNKTNGDEQDPKAENEQLREELKKAWGLAGAACEVINKILGCTFPDDHDKAMQNIGVIREKCDSFLRQSGWYDFKKREDERKAAEAAKVADPSAQTEDK